MTEQSIGVGPYPEPWPDDSKYDRDLLEHGDKRNVIDKYRYWTVDAIRQDLAKSSSSLQIAVENWQHDFNIGTIVRSANAFNVSKVHIIGKNHWNRRGAMVTDRYLEVIHHDSIDKFQKMMVQENRQIIGFDIIDGAENLSKCELPNNAVFVFGAEGPGLSREMIDICEKIVAIEQFGSTRSINLGVAAGIAMYVWVERNIIDK